MYLGLNNMREIKFRVWNSTGKRMLYDSSLAIRGCKIVQENKNIIMQFTGLKDKNGTDIYEGDIISYGKYYGGTDLDGKDCLHIVVWDVINARFSTIEIETDEESGSIDNGVCVIMGNKFKNTELLKK